MNNLVKFLILNFLILYTYSLNAEEEKIAHLKCHLEIKNEARILLIRLDLVEMKYNAYQSKDKPMHLGDFWLGSNRIFLFGENDEFYAFRNLAWWQRSMKFNGRFGDFPLSMLTEDETVIDRETLELKNFPNNKYTSQKCTLINKEEYVNYVNEWNLLFGEFLEAERMLFEEEEARREREREEQRKRYKL